MGLIDITRMIDARPIPLAFIFFPVFFFFLEVHTMFVSVYEITFVVVS